MQDILKNRHLYLVGAIVILLLFVMIFKFPYKIKAPCHIVGEKEWALIQVEPDKLLSKIYDNLEDKTQYFTLLQFAREDFVQFRQKSSLGSSDIY